MTKNKKKTYFITLLLAFIIPLEAQQFSNARFEQEGKTINIYYDLQGVAGEQYEVSVYCSIEGCATWGQSLQKVTDNISTEQKAGNRKLFKNGQASFK